MAPRCVAVAASGGRDSTALLHCTVRQAAALGVEVLALHVHHGLMPEADQWLQQVRAQARRWGARFVATRLQTRPEPGQSVEAWARRERYRALADMAQKADCNVVLLAHHRRDQAETWLLQALRGAGPAGLAAMPQEALRTGLHWCRPWLQQPRKAVEAYVQRHRLRYIDDSSNSDARYARNRLRQQVWPALLQAFPDAETALVAAAGHAQAAQALAAEVAAADLQSLWLGPEPPSPALPLQAWLQLPPARRTNVLRHWLRQTLGQGAPETLVQRLLQDLAPPAARALKGGTRWPAPGGELRLHQGLVDYVPQTRSGSMAGALSRAVSEGAPAAVSGPASAVCPDPPPLVTDLNRPGHRPVPAWGGHFEVRRVDSGGAPLALLRDVSLRPRAGGERFAAQPQAMPRSLKKQYQAAAVPAWQRQGPLVWAADGRLLYVPALGINAACLAAAGQPQCSLRWVPGPD